ncbi:MAG: hypothetical protein ACXWNK_11390 [Vulcanimicrobiaceae bacterium]
MRAWIGSCVGALIAAIAIMAPASANSGSATVSWYTQAIIKMTLTPNYASGCGTVKAVFGTQPTPTPPSGGCLSGGPVDFGTLTAGLNYLYMYAAHISVASNDTNGFNLYGEGSADFYNTTDGSSTPLNQTLYYLPSSSGGDTNTGFSPSLPFARTTSSVTGGSFTTPAAITYGTYPAPIASSSNASSDLYYDYQLKVPPTATAGAYYVWVVYTVVPR